MTIVTDTHGQPWEAIDSEPTQHGFTLYRGFPQEGPRPGGPPQAIPTRELIDLLWRVGSEDALRTLPISRGAVTRLRRIYGITAATQKRRLKAQQREAEAHRLPGAQPLAVLASPDASRHDPSPAYAQLLVEELCQSLGRTQIAERAGIDYVRVLTLSDGDAGLTYPEQYIIERLVARGRLIDTIQRDGHPTPQRIRESREAAGITVTRAATLVRTAPKFWQAWEAGEKPMPLHRWELWCCKLRDLTGDT